MEVDDGWPWGPVQDGRGAAGGPTESQVPPKVSFYGSHCTVLARPALLHSWLVGLLVVFSALYSNCETTLSEQQKTLMCELWAVGLQVKCDVSDMFCPPLSLEISERGANHTGPSNCTRATGKCRHGLIVFKVAEEPLPFAGASISYMVVTVITHANKGRR